MLLTVPVIVTERVFILYLQQLDGNWELVDQSVHGNDYWQAYSDVDEGSFTLIYNVHNRGTNTYRLTQGS